MSLFAFHVHVFGKGMTLSVLSQQPLVKRRAYLVLKPLVRQPVEEKENSDFKPAVLCFKVDFVSIPVHCGGVR